MKCHMGDRKVGKKDIYGKSPLPVLFLVSLQMPAENTNRIKAYRKKKITKMLQWNMLSNASIIYTSLSKCSYRNTLVTT